MARGRGRKGNGNSRAQPLMTRFKKNPITVTKAEIKKLGAWKYPLGLVGAGLLTAPFADELVNMGTKISPSLGSVMGIFTGYGKSLATRLKA